MKELLIGDRADVLILDDQVDSLRLLMDVLAPAYTVHPFLSSQVMLDYLSAGRPADLVLLDIVMPPPNGYEVCRRLREMPEMEDVPIIFISALDTPVDEAKGLALGAVDYVSKPIVPAIVMTRVATHVRLGRAMRLILTQNEHLDRRVAERTEALARKNAELSAAVQRIARTQDATLFALTSLASTRDNETGQHILRTQAYVRELAQRLHRHPAHRPTLDDETVEVIAKSAALHDIGKVAIPDAILHKPGRLDTAEFEIMKTHTTHGWQALSQAEAALQGEAGSFLRHARDIARSHHERWDGTGYPRGLRGAQTPLSARLMAVADVYDALISRRVYKAPMPHDEALHLIAQQRGRHFDPDVVDALMADPDRFNAIAQTHRDEPG